MGHPDERRTPTEDPGGNAPTDPLLAAAWSSLKAQRAAHGALDPSAVDVVSSESSDNEAREVALDSLLQEGQTEALSMVHVMREAARDATGALSEQASSTGAVSRRRFLRWWPAPLAAAAIVVFMLQSRNTSHVNVASDVPAVRGNTTTVSLVAPASGAGFNDSTQFVWTAVPDATGYAIRWLDADGATVATRKVTMPSATLPTLDAATRRRIIAWTVDASTRDGLRVQSEFRALKRR